MTPLKTIACLVFAFLCAVSGYVTAQVVRDAPTLSAPPRSFGPVSGLLRLAGGDAFLEARNSRFTSDRTEYFDGVVITVGNVRITADRVYRDSNVVGSPMPDEARLEGNVRMSFLKQPPKP